MGGPTIGISSPCLEYGIKNMEYWIWNLEYWIWNLEYWIWNMEYGIWNMGRPTIWPFFLFGLKIFWLTLTILVLKVKPVEVPSSTRSVIYVFKVVHMQTVTKTHVRQIIWLKLDFVTFIREIIRLFWNNLGTIKVGVGLGVTNLAILLLIVKSYVLKLLLSAKDK